MTNMANRQADSKTAVRAMDSFSYTLCFFCRQIFSSTHFKFGKD